MGVRVVDLGPGCDPRAGHGGHFTDACRARHVGDDIEPVLDVHAKTKVQVPVQIQADAAVHRQVQTRHANIETQIQVRRIGLPQVHAKLDGGAASQSQLGTNFLGPGLNGLLELAQYRFGNDLIRSGQVMVLVVLERGCIRCKSTVAGLESLGHIRQGGCNDAGAKNIFQQVAVVIPCSDLVNNELCKSRGRSGKAGTVICRHIGQQICGRCGNAVNGTRNVINNLLKTAIEHNVARLPHVNRCAIVMQHRVAQAVKFGHVDA